MPASSPWLDTWAPPQFGFRAGVGADDSPAPATSGQDSGFYAGLSMNPASANSNVVDTNLHWKVSGAILIGLVIVFGLHAMGFRFVTSANVSVGR